MAIAQSKYVAITSGVGGASAAGRKDLILRVYTSNELFPENIPLEFPSSADVAEYCGSTSFEAKIAAAYFGWVSKSVNSPKKISFMRASLEATAPTLRSTKALSPLTDFTAVTAGTLTISMGGTSYTASSLDLSAVTSYSDVATVLETAIQENTSGGALWTAADISYNAETSSFILTGGETGEAVITYATGDVAELLGWDEGTHPILSVGTDAKTLTDILNKSIEISDNFGSYAFANFELSADDIDEIGTWNDEQNFMYIFCGNVGSSNYSALINKAANHKGMAICYDINYGDSTKLPAYLMPATIFAATNYNKVNGTVNYMYQQFPAQAVSVDTNSLANTLDNLHINYNGQTQKAGDKIEFFQDGYLADGTDIGVFANEIWLKDAMITELLNLEVALEKIPANDDGLAYVENVLQNVIGEALSNGTISTGKILTNTQKAYITQITGDDTAWKEVSLNGYVLTVTLRQELVNGATKYIADYTLPYAKGDSIRKIEGRHILI